MKVKYIKLPPAPVSLTKEDSADNLNFYIKDNGPLDMEHAARSCNRCGACLQRCPSFKALKSEIYSPRGRSQLLKFIFERKLNIKKDKTDILNTSYSCLMCGNCLDFCPAKTPTAGLMMALNNHAAGKRKSKAAFYRSMLYIPAAKLKIKNALKKQQQDGKEIVFTPSFYSAEQIKNTLQIINEAGFKAIVNFSLMPLEYYYFSADIKNIKKSLSKLPSGQEIITDSIETFAILKRAEMFGEEFKELAQSVKFISSIIKPSKNFCAEIKNKTLLIYQNNIAPGSSEITAQIRNLLSCSKKLFLVECIESKELAPSAAAHWVKIKGEKLIKSQISAMLNDIKADYLITASYTDKKLFSDIVKKLKSDLKVIHINQIPEVLYAQNARPNSD